MFNLYTFQLQATWMMLRNEREKKKKKKINERKFSCCLTWLGTEYDAAKKKKEIELPMIP